MEKQISRDQERDISLSGRVCIVIPSRNAREFLDQTLFSLVSQAGPFRLHIHVQDGESSDGTLEAAEAWRLRLQAGHVPVLCEEIAMSTASEADAGMYDAINKGFTKLQAEPGDLMAWLNADDVLLPGAVRFAMDRMRQFPEIAWMGSRPSEADAGMVTTKIHEPQVYPSKTLAAGLHDGRHLRFVMQEGSFWRGWLWREAGGLRPDLRLAGDFDLWRRFASITPLYTADVVLAVHRRHAGQLSKAMEAYYREIDELVIPEEDKARTAACWRAYEAWRDAEPFASGADFSGSAVVFDPSRGAWEEETRPLPVPLRPSLTQTITGQPAAMIPARYVSGFSEPQPGSQNWNLLAGSRFASSGANRVEFLVPRRRVYALQIVCRNFSKELRLSVRRTGAEVLSIAVPPTGHERETVLTGSLYLDAGANTVELLVDGPDGAPQRGLLVASVGVLPL